MYGLGAILYELLTGTAPRAGEGVAELLEAIRRDDLAPPDRLNPEVPRELAAICLKCLRRRPGDRYPTAGALADDLRTYLAGEPIKARPVARRVRFARWARRPERLREAGIVTIATNLGMLVWLTFTTPIVLGLIPQLFAGGVTAVEEQLAVIAGHLVGVAAGIGMLRARRWALWIATGLGSINMAAALVVLVGLVEPFAGAYRDPLLRVLLFSILGAMFSIWLGMCVMIVVARGVRADDG